MADRIQFPSKRVPRTLFDGNYLTAPPRQVRLRAAGDRLRGVTEVVRSRWVGRVAVVELHRPQVRHAMDTNLLDQLIAALRRAGRAGETDAVVVTGSDGCFSSGADVSEDVDRAGAQARMAKFAALYELVATYPLPTVAAISGWCIGGGAELASA